MQKYKNDVYNDGYLYYGYEEDILSETKKKVGSKFNELGKLAYQEMSKRERDYSLADSTSGKLDMKVKTPYPPSFKTIKATNLIIKIEEKRFEVISVDSDADKRNLFFYLQKVGAK